MAGKTRYVPSFPFAMPPASPSPSSSQQQQLLPVLLLLLGTSSVHAFLPFQNPIWPPTYDMSMSTLTMACNSSGWFNLTVGAAFGITSYDWSNAKAQWAVQRPMDCEERLVQQAVMTKAANPRTNVFVYRNLVKALPWFTTVRVKLEDPAYAGFFLKFKPGGAFPNGTYHVPNCDTFYDPPLCSEFYHDQEQTPEVPTPSDPHPDGSCSGTCDCGKVPCGEYLFDHRNGSMLQQWLLEEVIFGPNGLDNPQIDGYFIDDFWCSNIINGTGNCNDPVQGPTEIDAHSQADMGLSDQDIADITRGWLETMTLVQKAILAAGGYTWSLIPGQDNANASPVMIGPDSKSCNAELSRACSQATSPWQDKPLLMGLHPGNDTNPLPYVDQEVAGFLLMRGPYAWLGYGVWGMSWPAGSSFDFKNSTVLRPPQMDTDYGEPVAAYCKQVSSGVFSRTYTKAEITLDCNKWQATIKMQ